MGFGPYFGFHRYFIGGPVPPVQHFMVGGVARPAYSTADDPFADPTQPLTPEQQQANKNSSTPGWTNGPTQPAYSHNNPSPTPIPPTPAPASTTSNGVPIGIQGSQDSGLLGTEAGQVNANDYTLPGYSQFETSTGIGQRNAMGYQPGVGQMNGDRQSQNVLASMLFNQARGNGPSVAQNQLQQTTQNNIANQFAMAQANANDGGALRNLSTNMGNLNQQAASQGALLRAQEQQSAMGQLGSVLGQARGQDLTQFQNANQAGLGWADLGLKGAEAEQHGTIAMAGQQAQNYANAAAGKQKIIGSITGAASGAGEMGMKSGAFSPGHGTGFGGSGDNTGGDAGGGGDGGGTADPGENTSGDYRGGEILGLHARLHPEQYANGGQVPATFLLGGAVSGRAAVDGNSPKNDTVPAVLSPGEIVLPRSVTEDPEAAEKAKLFVQAIMKKHKGGK